MGLRRKAREIAVQTLYALSFSESEDYLENLEIINHYSDKLKEILADSDIDTEGPIFEFADEIVRNTLKQMSDIDKLIKENSINWTFEKIAIMDKCVLRSATYELRYTDTAPPIIMNEAIEISKKFCSENSKKFINGILNAISERIHEK